MTRREEIEKAAMQVGGVHPDWDALECFRVGYKEGAKWADKTMIEKACEILENVTVTYNKRFFGKCEENVFDADFIKEFRQAMEK